MKTPFSIFFVAALMILASLSACKKENSATHSSSTKTQAATPSEQKQQAPHRLRGSRLPAHAIQVLHRKQIGARKPKASNYQRRCRKKAQVQKAYADFQQKMQNGTFTTREQAEAAQLRIQRMQQEGAKLENNCRSA